MSEIRVSSLSSNPENRGVEMKSALVSLSGGMDSATVLAEAIDRLGKKNVAVVGFNYGSKHNPYENLAAENLADFYGLSYNVIDLKSAMMAFKSNLLTSGGSIPEGHYEDVTMSQTVVPARNIIFSSILSGLAWSFGIDSVWLGIHQGDHFIYEDCRPDFFKAMDAAIKFGTGNRVGLYAPFLGTNKLGILRRGTELGVPYALTRTCYKAQNVACGKCGSCQERLEAFSKLGIEDPIGYDSREIVPKAK